MAQRKAGRGWGAVRAETEAGRQLTEFLRGLLDNAGQTLEDLEVPTNYSKSTVQEYISGRKLPSESFVERTVVALSPVRERELNLRKALRLLNLAKNPPPVQLPTQQAIPAQAASDTEAPAADVAAVQAGLVSVAATAQDQAAQAQQQLAVAHDRNQRLTEERDQYQQMVVALSGLTADLQRQVEEVAGIPDPEAEQSLAELTAQLHAAQSELERARASRDEAELLAQRLWQHSNELEEQLALMRQRAAAIPALPPGLHSLPDDLRDAFFQTDVERMLQTAQSFLDEGQATRDQARDEWGLGQPGRRPVIGPVERWRTSSRVLARALGCSLAVSGAVAYQLASEAEATFWTAPLTLLIIVGLVVTCDPAGPAVRLWPAVQALLHAQPLAQPIPISAQDLARRALRGLIAALTASLSLLVVLAVTRWSSWWLLPLIPAAAACAGYTIVGGDREVTLLVQEALGRLAANLQTPRHERGPAAPRRLPVVLADPQWIEARRSELGAAFASGFTQAAPWIKIAVWAMIGLLLFATVGSVASALPPLHPYKADLGGMATAVDTPVRAYLAAHTEGLPISATAVRQIWLAAGVGLLAVSFLTGTFGARLTWTLWGAATAAMVWWGTQGQAKQVATGLAILGWGIASILALQGLGVRRAPSQHQNVTVQSEK
ncbi:hypothetical protein ACFU7Y_42060 [Kitasatospora sp. NPDC057542]|uniref:hypothetical protein n=1 Tax=Kitasatospora sp. NPDC057542 TaxID=3346162 RepID=UPI00369D0093